MGRVGRIDKIDFEYLLLDDVVCHVKKNSKGIYMVENLTDNSWESVFRGSEPSDEGVIRFFKSRCFSPERPDKNLVLDSLGLMVYDPISIVKKTHGTFFCDSYWIRFKGEKLDFASMREEVFGKDWRSMYTKKGD